MVARLGHLREIAVAIFGRYLTIGFYWHRDRLTDLPALIVVLVMSVIVLLCRLLLVC